MVGEGGGMIVFFFFLVFRVFFFLFRGSIMFGWYGDYLLGGADKRIR